MRKKFLIVDDEELNRELLRKIFEDEYDILMAENGKEAVRKIGKYSDEIAVILLDIVMPVFNGYQVMQILHSRKIIEKIPVILITAQTDEKIEFSCYQLGASAVISKPFASKIVKKRVESIIEMHENMDLLEEQLDQEHKKLADFQEKLLETISNLVEFRNLETGLHVKRVKQLTRIMAAMYQMLYPEDGLTDESVENIVRASATHDIGKIAVPDSILLKPGRLTREEREIMMTHTNKGCEILNMIVGVQDKEQYQACYDICRYHHERYDGKGYPDGLKGDEIPLSAQIVSLVDVYEALVSERVYKKPYDKETAYKMILDGQCGVFSPKITECFKYAKSTLEQCIDGE